MCAVMDENVEMVRDLIDDPEVNLDYFDHWNNIGYTFHCACKTGNVEIVKLFLDCKRYIIYNRRDNDGRSGLLCAHQHTPVIRLLLDDPRMDANLKDYKGNGILDNMLDTSIKPILACPRAVFSGRRIRQLLGWARGLKRHELADALEAYTEDPDAAREQFRQDLGYYPDKSAGELFAVVVLLCDGYLELKE